MSASLVGSEMCIRDRSFPVPHLCKFPHMGRTQGSPGRRAMGGDFEGMAVSYTHLTLPTICSV
eukprot:2855111-Alexandrium_andersonii.AAC.1